MSDQAPGRKKPETLTNIAWQLGAIVRKCYESKIFVKLPLSVTLV
jgi:hypothetical protein